MSVSLVTLSKNTRGKDSRTITYQGIGRQITRTIQRETNLDGTPITAKDADGNLITRPEEVTEWVSDGVVTDLNDALELVGGDTQKFLDMFAVGFNRVAYQTEADKDELDIYCEGLDEKTAKARKTLIRGLAKQVPSFTLKDAAEAIMEAVNAGGGK